MNKNTLYTQTFFIVTISIYLFRYVCIFSFICLFLSMLQYMIIMY